VLNAVEIASQTAVSIVKYKNGERRRGRAANAVATSKMTSLGTMSNEKAIPGARINAMAATAPARK
jgi:hypothetical protein